MVCGTTSDAGKTVVVAGLCRLLARQGIRVAPFKAQNMALNSYVTTDGAEIGRAQAFQAAGAGIEPEAAMNPILLKPTGERRSQVVVMGKAQGDSDAMSYQARKEMLWPVVTGALDELRRRYDVVVCEGAGSPAEINLADHDIVNLRVADHAGFRALVVGDIEKGGVFAGLFGTHALVPDRYRPLISGFVINRFRGDPELLKPGLDQIHQRTGVPVLGVVPRLDDLAIDAEDSLALASWANPHSGKSSFPDSDVLGSYVDGDVLGSDVPDRDVLGSDVLDVAVVAFPRISNFTDFDPLRAEPNLSVRLVADGRRLGRPDLVILPGSKSTVADLDWLRSVGLESAIRSARDGGTWVLGLCAGYQMLGHTIDDEVESGRGRVSGLGFLDVSTHFVPDKITRRVSGRAMGENVTGYLIHHGRTTAGPGDEPWMVLDGLPEGAIRPPLAGTSLHGPVLGTSLHTAAVAGTSVPGPVLGTSLHGLFESDRLRSRFLGEVARSRRRTFVASALSFETRRQAQLDRVADALATHLDMAFIENLIRQGSGPSGDALAGDGHQPGVPTREGCL